MATLYHCKGARSLRPLWTAEELGVEIDLVTLPFPPRARQKDYLAVNPLGTVPFFIEGETKMTESVAICDYLVRRHGPTPLEVRPEELEFGAYLNWLYYSDATLTFPMTIQLRYTQLEPEERRLPQAVADYRAFYVGRLKLLEAAIGEREFLCGGRFTIADVCVGYALSLATFLGLEDTFNPAVADYWRRLSERPAFQRAAAR